ncbi:MULTISPECIES: ABC transporter ATP-binding protein [unclassified Micromonospora]|uniref:ABC transporter ATP-binding protein n=1 Tax=unclassified Micromonospora TaxID=2617518 RepID=UPI00332110F1
MTVDAAAAAGRKADADAPAIELAGVDVVHTARSGGLFRPDRVYALTAANFTVRRGETVGIVGESGCGKSTLAKVLVGLQAPTNGTVRFRGAPLGTGARARREFGRAVSVIFQDPATALNPRMRVEEILRDALDVHGIGVAGTRQARVRELLDLVGLPPSAVDVLPSQLSGGQRQRVAIARALALDPDVVVADEPTSALDVSVRAQVLNLLIDLKARLGLGLVFISHDIQTVRYVADRIAVMYLGRIVEEGPAELVAGRPRHPYTKALFSAAPRLLERTDRVVLSGPVPSASHPPSGCPFRTRCWRATEACATRFPAATADGGHRWHCIHPLDPDRPTTTTDQETL